MQRSNYFNKSINAKVLKRYLLELYYIYFNKDKKYPNYKK